MRDVILYGDLSKNFGKSFSFHADSVPEVIQALAANFPDFLNSIRHGFYKIVVGDNRKSGVELDEQNVASYDIGQENIHIIPVTQGSRRGGLGKILAGILLIGLASVTGGAALISTKFLGTSLGGIMTSMGTGLVIAGVSSFLAPEQDGKDKDEKSFTMSGPQVNLREGGIVPIAYGQVVTGGTMISGILRIENGEPESETNPKKFASIG